MIAERLNRPPRGRLAPALGVVLALVALAALVAFRPGIASSARAASAGFAPFLPVAPYRQQLGAIFARERASLADGDRLLTLHDADPPLGTDPAWQAAHEKVVKALATNYQAARALQPDAGDAPLQSCATQSLRLIWTGHAMLHRAFQIDGHGAYYNSAHGNWDLDLGINRLRACEAMLRS